MTRISMLYTMFDAVLDSRMDRVFKRIFEATKNKNVLIGFFNDILVNNIKRPIVDVISISNEFPLILFFKTFLEAVEKLTLSSFAICLNENLFSFNEKISNLETKVRRIFMLFLLVKIFVDFNLMDNTNAWPFSIVLSSKSYPNQYNLSHRCFSYVNWRT